MFSRLTKFLLVTHIFLDVLVNMGSIGLYNSDWKFDGWALLKVFDITSYDYWTSPLDILILCLLRQISLIIAVILKTRGKTLEKWIPLYDIQSPMGVFLTGIKFLCFCEGSTSELPGARLNAGFTVFFNISLLILIRCNIAVKSKEMSTYSRLPAVNQDSSSVENGAPSTSSVPASSESTGETDLTFWDITVEFCKIIGSWRRNTFIFILVLLQAFLIVYETYIAASIISNVSSKGPADEFDNLIFTAFYVGVSCSLAIITLCAYISYSKADIEQRIKNSFFGALMRQDMSFFDSFDAGKLVSRVTNDCQVIAENLPEHVKSFMLGVTLFVCAVVSLAKSSLEMTALSLIFLVPGSLVSRFYSPLLAKLSTKKKTANATETGSVTEAISGIRTVQAFDNEDKMAQQFAGNVNATFKINMDMIVIYLIQGVFSFVLYDVFTYITYKYGSHLIDSGRMERGDFVTFTMQYTQMRIAYRMLRDQIKSYSSTVGAAVELFRIWHRQPRDDYRSGTETPEIKGEVIFKNVEFSYPSRPNLKAIDNVNLTAPEGDVLALVGPSGNGKTTLISLLQRFYPVSLGQILLDNTPIQNIASSLYRKSVSIVAQEPMIFSGTIRYNIIFGLEDATEEDMMRAAEEANVLEFVNPLEAKFDTECGPNGVKLSGGQKQRIAIARALIRNPKVLILDEATSALDADSEEQVQVALTRCSSRRTVIVIAHRLSTIRHANCIAYIKDGQVFESGTHEQLMLKDGSPYRAMVQKTMRE